MEKEIFEDTSEFRCIHTQDLKFEFSTYIADIMASCTLHELSLEYLCARSFITSLYMLGAVTFGEYKKAADALSSAHDLRHSQLVTQSRLLKESSS